MKKVKHTIIDIDLIRLLIEMKVPNRDILGVMAYCKGQIARKKLINYLYFKGKYATFSDVLLMCGALTRERYQYLPMNMYVRYVGFGANGLIHDEDYWVKTVYGRDESVYEILNEKHKYREYPAKDFIILQEKKIVYRGVLEKDGSTTITEGFEKGKEYSVVGREEGMFVCDNGKKCYFFEIDPVELEPKPFKEKRNLSISSALNIVRNGIEFADVHILYGRLTAESVLYSANKQKNFSGADEICDYLEDIGNQLIAKNRFVDVATATVIEGENSFGHLVGEKYLKIFYYDQDVSAVFVTVNGAYITKIDITYDFPKHTVDVV